MLPLLLAREIIDSLDLRRPIYRQPAAYGHFGRAEPDFTWERVDQAQEWALLKEALNKPFDKLRTNGKVFIPFV
jgi:S-adenosylmethionine synthetase